MPFFGLFLARGEMKVMPFKTVQLLLRRQQQGQGVQQAGFTPGVFTQQQRVVVQHQRQPVNAAKTCNLDTL
ncbi:hypothetical protein D3C71_1547160 [compost metagenome]